MLGGSLRLLRALVALGAVVGATLALAGPAGALSTNVVVSQVFGGGGNTGAPYQNDFVELFNRSASPVSLAGWSVQYTSATGTGTFASQPIATLSGVLQPGQYYLVQEGAGAGNGVPLPTPDASSTAAMAAGAGKVIVANTTTGLACNGDSTPCSAAQLAQIVDLVGYGNANFFEGAAAAPTLTNTTSGSRKDSGCTETDQNGNDFAAGTVSPRNTLTAAHFCTTDDAPSVSSTTPANGGTGVAVDANVSLTFSEPVNVTGSWYSISCGTSGTHTAVASGGPDDLHARPRLELCERRDLHGHRRGRERQRPGHGRPAGHDGRGLRLQLHDGRRAAGRHQPGLRRRRQRRRAVPERLRRALQPRHDAPVDLSGWSVQYASSAGTTWQVTTLTGVRRSRASTTSSQEGGRRRQRRPAADAGRDRHDRHGGDRRQGRARQHDDRALGQLPDRRVDRRLRRLRHGRELLRRQRPGAARRRTRRADLRKGAGCQDTTTTRPTSSPARRPRATRRRRSTTAAPTPRRAWRARTRRTAPPASRSAPFVGFVLATLGGVSAPQLWNGRRVARCRRAGIEVGRVVVRVVAAGPRSGGRRSYSTVPASGPLPSKQFAAVPKPTKSKIVAPAGQLPASAVVVLTSATFPAAAAIAIVPRASAVGRLFAVAGSRPLPARGSTGPALMEPG